MNHNTLRQKLSAGVVSFPVTTFKPDLPLDLEGYRANLRFIIKHPVCSVVAAAGTGELYSLSPAEHRAVVQATVEEVKGRVPVIAGTGFNHPIAVELAKHSAAVGADGILALPPYYPNADEDGLFEYYKAIADATPLGLLIYSRDWVNPGPAIVERLAQLPAMLTWTGGQADLRPYQALHQHLAHRLPASAAFAPAACRHPHVLLSVARLAGPGAQRVAYFAVLHRHVARDFVGQQH